MRKPPHILPVIVISQFCCTSLWFAPNAVMADLISTFDLPFSSLGHLTSVVQLGFITGTFLFALLMIADRFSPSKVFFACALAGSLINLTTLISSNTIVLLLLERGLVGFFLAGIYPIGMKIASDYYQVGLGRSLGYLVGALVLGTAFPHIISATFGAIDWSGVIISASVLGLTGGVLMLLLVKDGPYRKASQRIELQTIPIIFKDKKFRSAAFGYFGHMWELYAFWAFVPVMLLVHQDLHGYEDQHNSILAGIIIGLGGLSCIAGGILSERLGTKRLATRFLLLSGLCCLLSPLLFLVSSTFIFISFMILWGLVVIADSPLFSTLVATHAPPQYKGTALTIVNCIGFAITIISIQLLTYLQTFMSSKYLFLVLVIGPIFGCWQLKTKS